MLKELLSAILTKKQREAGLYLEEEGDFLYLKQGEITRITFSQTGATVVEIREEAEKWVSSH